MVVGPGRLKKIRKILTAKFCREFAEWQKFESFYFIASIDKTIFLKLFLQCHIPGSKCRKGQLVIKIWNNDCYMDDLVRILSDL